ncbi:hypothetical protein [Streptomyces sp. H51]|uniref:hypothetical protein n=1 Tax=Streptomyces sp. H51 TaxID=3111770 RepID=UPI002D76E2BB|nr:hypothetical protein [Streptomyces sp. H51]
MKALIPLVASGTLLSSVLFSGIAVADPLIGSEESNGNSAAFDRPEDEYLLNNSTGSGNFVWCQNQVTNTLVNVPQSSGALAAVAASFPTAAVAGVVPQSPPVSTSSSNAPSHNQCA